MMTICIRKNSKSILSGRGGNQQGIALLVVLWIMTMLTVIVGQFCYSMRSEINITRNFRDSSKAYYQSRAGVQEALLQLLESGTQKNTIEIAESEFSGLLPWRINVENPSVTMGDGSYEVRLGNESGKININTAHKTLLALMFGGLEIDDEDVQVMVDSIQDWRDLDDFHRNYGAENDYYQRLAVPYECQNGPFHSVEDLLLVRGFTEEILTAVRKRITVFPKKNMSKPSKDVGKGKKGENKKPLTPIEQKTININAASPDMLAALPLIDDILIQDIIAFREESDFLALSEVKAIVGEEIYSLLSRYITLDTSTYYSITSVGHVAEGRAEHTIYVVIDVDTEMAEYTYIQWIDSI